MAYGIEVWNSKGEKTLEHSDRLARLVHSEIIRPTDINDSGTISLPDIAGYKTVEIALAAESTDSNKKVVEVERDGTDINWDTPRYDGSEYIPTLIYVFIYS